MFETDHEVESLIKKREELKEKIEQIKKAVEEVKKMRLKEARELDMSYKSRVIVANLGKCTPKMHGYLCEYESEDKEIKIVIDTYIDSIEIRHRNNVVFSSSQGELNSFNPYLEWLKKFEVLFYTAKRRELENEVASLEEELKKWKEIAKGWGIDV